MVIYYIVDRYSANTEYRLSLDWLPCSRIVNTFSFFFFVFESLMIWKINFKDRSSAENKNLKLKLRMQEGSIDRSPNRSKLNQKRSNWLANSNFTSIKAHFSFSYETTKYTSTHNGSNNSSWVDKIMFLRFNF